MRNVLVVTSLFATALYAQQDLSKVEIRAQEVASRIHLLQGAGGNVGVLVGDDFVVVIDDQYAPLTPKILAAVRAISPHPIRYVINTHWHGDHTGGNENMGRTGAVIVAHDNVRERMSTEQFNGLWNRTTPPSPDGALPVITFSETVTFHVEDEEVHVIHLPNAHTDGDSIVWFPRSNVLHTGDLYFQGGFPYVDASSGGTLDGIIAAGDRILSIVNDSTKIIPGHGALSNAAEYRRYHSMMKDVRSRLAALHAKGITVEEAIEAKPLEDLEDAWGGGFIKSDMMIRIVWPQLAGAHSHGGPAHRH